MLTEQDVRVLRKDEIERRLETVPEGALLPVAVVRAIIRKFRGEASLYGSHRDGMNL